MKITDGQKKGLRFGLWIASLCWGLFFLAYTAVIFDRAVLPWLEKAYTGFPLWVSAIFYILCVLSAVFIFFWFFTRLMEREK